MRTSGIIATSGLSASVRIHLVRSRGPMRDVAPRRGPTPGGHSPEWRDAHPRKAPNVISRCVCCRRCRLRPAAVPPSPGSVRRYGSRLRGACAVSKPSKGEDARTEAGLFVCVHESVCSHRALDLQPARPYFCVLDQVPRLR